MLGELAVKQRVREVPVDGTFSHRLLSVVGRTLLGFTALRGLVLRKAEGVG